MKQIISTTGQKITFLLKTDRKIVIDTSIPLEVPEAEFKILKSRLGRQIKVVNTTMTPETETPPVVEAEAAPVTETPASTDAETVLAPEVEATPETETPPVVE